MTAGAWTETVSRLWPGSDVSHVHRRGGQLVFLPNAREARILLPLGAPRAAGAALRRFSHDLGPRARLGRGLLSLALRTGLPQRLLPDRVRVGPADGPSVQDRLSDLLGQPVVVSVTIGNERANRKPVLQALTPSGRSLAFVKIGDTDVARALIAAEADALRTLSACPPRGIRTPQLIAYESWGTVDALVMSVLSSGVRRWRPRDEMPVGAMAELASITATTAELAGSPFWNGLTATPDLLPDGEAASRLAAVLDRLGERHGGVRLSYGAWHGDWTPWNMAWQRDVLHLWDWERFAQAVPVGFDALHYALQQIGPTTSWTVQRVWSGDTPSVLAPFGLKGPAASTTLSLYLAELCARYLVASRGSIGAPLRAQADALLDLLDRHTTTS
ncbi:hypothetical protein [Nonomuraea cavernae]|uniref:Aminoglycoside phosphotransferase domain-containing protein n=1 Tax=Nonomuraea cavernae TaxID=2045107 RepID=A0A918DKL9_9ACTN|nr:hypothetical protein [Nonomuraea cavernae]MCA2186085.1 hypothetical protein [Nonomuraea cavernae]GGO70255.1 hypothetical protein GCM10012289_33280 [Nonomuraea cavernae]